MSPENANQPTLSELVASYLDKQAKAPPSALELQEEEVTPYDVGPVHAIDPERAWDEALGALGPAATQCREAPPHWSALVANHEPLVAIAFAVGNFPQLLRRFQSILTEPDLLMLRPVPGAAADAPDLAGWAEKLARTPRFPQLLFVPGVLRLARHYDAAEEFLCQNESHVPAEWRTAWDNEKAALAWRRGRFEQARELWDVLEPTQPVLFNRGMAALFANDLATAREHLLAAVASIPQTSAWFHLGRLYLTMIHLREHPREA